jgi:hypothetical protein
MEAELRFTNDSIAEENQTTQKLEAEIKLHSQIIQDQLTSLNLSFQVVLGPDGLY